MALETRGCPPAFYNEWDINAAGWLSRLALKGIISGGVCHVGSIKDIGPQDITHRSRAHFFAGIGGWDYALRLAGWPADRRVWTGSCPCQPFSSAGKRQGQADERHLWPEWFRLIRECRPDTIFGEQVASAIGHGWLDGVFADLEGIGYTCGAVVLGAHSVGAPHIRQRLWWVADAGYRTSGIKRQDSYEAGRAQQAQWGRQTNFDAARCVATCGLGITRRDGSQGECEAGATCGTVERACAVGGVEFANGCGCDEAHCAIPPRQFGEASPWAGATTIPCGDGKTRRLEPGISPLVDGVPARVVRLRGYGNAIVPQVAAAFVRAFLECEAERC